MERRGRRSLQLFHVILLVTALNVVGDSACAMAVAKSENALDETVYRA